MCQGHRPAGRGGQKDVPKEVTVKLGLKEERGNWAGVLGVKAEGAAPAKAAQQEET